jgi:hypothetical protein
MSGAETMQPTRDQIATEIRDRLTKEAEHSEAMARLGKYRSRYWMSDGTTVIVEVCEPTKASRAARERNLAKLAARDKAPA